MRTSVDVVTAAYGRSICILPRALNNKLRTVRRDARATSKNFRQRQTESDQSSQSKIAAKNDFNPILRYINRSCLTHLFRDI